MRRNILIIVVIALVMTLAVPSQAFAAKKWSRAELRAEVRRACKAYDIGTKRTRWLERAAVDIVYDGAHESSGAWHAGKGECRGIFQFDSGWHQSKRDKRRAKAEGHKHDKHGWRHCAKCSTWRFARSYRDGGKAAIKRHWKATYGR